MNYSLSKILAKYKVNPQKKWGQNWITNEHVINKIINITNLENQEIVEIGPGLGALTFSLANYAKSIIAYEIDELAIKILKSEISSEILQIYHEDFLQATFPWSNRKIVIGNIPYYITTDIIFKILENSHLFSKVILTVQDEVADRLAAPVGSKNYSKLTVTVNFFADVQKHFVIKSQDFYPQPKVNSAVVSFNLKPGVDFVSHQKFVEFIKKCFAFKRKTLVNNLKIFISNQEQIAKILTKMSLKFTVRPQQLNIYQFRTLYDFFYPSQLK